MTRIKNTSGIDKLLDNFIKNVPYRKKLEEARVIVAWPKVVGKIIEKRAKASAIKDGLLYVKVEHSVWRHELFMQKPSIVKKLNAYIGKSIVKDIRFQ